MSRIFIKLHLSEILIVASYFLLLVGYYLAQNFGMGFFFLICFICVAGLSIWSMVSLRKISFVLWPLYVVESCGYPY